MKRTYVMPLLVLTAICLVVSSALALMHSVTNPVIVSAAAQRAQEAMIEKIPNATGFEPIKHDSLDELPTTIKEIYRTTNNVGHIFIAAVSGFSGDITIICGVDPNGKIIDSSVLSHTETRGIGTIIEQESFLAPFRGMDSNHEGIDAVTGATISTRAYINAINDILAAFEVVARNLG